MKNTLYADVQFILNVRGEPNPKKAYPILVRLNLRSDRIEKSTKIKVKHSRWDSKNGMVTNKGKAGIDQDKAGFNEKLDVFRKGLIKAREIINSMDIVPSKENVWNEFLRLQKQEQLKKHANSQTLGFHSAQKQYLQHLKTNKELSTFKNVRSTFSDLERFEKKEYPLDYSLIGNRFRNDLKDFLQGNNDRSHLGISDVTFNKKLKHIKMFMSWSYKLGHHTSILYRDMEMVRILSKSPKYALTKDELDTLKQLDLSPKKHLEKARDIFVLGCEIGQRFSDYRRISKIHLLESEGIKFVKLKQKKTSKDVTIPLSSDAEAILKKYDYSLPPILEPILNRYLKIICKKAGFNEEMECYSQVRGKDIRSVKPKHELISTHTARRTFATLKIKEDVPSDVVMMITGHTTQASFNQYVNRSESEKLKTLIIHMSGNST